MYTFFFFVAVVFISDMGQVQSANRIVWVEVIQNDDYLPDLTDALILNDTMKPKSECGQKCYAREQCESFFHNRDTGACELYSTIFMTRQRLTKRSPGYRYNEIKHERCMAAGCFRYLRQLDTCVYWEKRVNRSYGQSQTRCKDMNSDLFLLHTEQRIKVFHSFLFNNFVSPLEPKRLFTLGFVGAYRENSTSPFKWENGQLLPSEARSYWFPLEGNINEHCLTICIRQNKSRWNTRRCSVLTPHTWCELN